MTFILFAPGSFKGPCEDGCQHQECHVNKFLAELPCFKCKGTIDFDNFFQIHGAKIAHAICVDKAFIPDQGEQTTSIMGG